MSSATAKYRNPDAPPGYVRPHSTEFDDVPIELMEKAYIDGIYCHYVAVMLDTGLFSDEDMTGLSDFELNTSDEEKEIEIEETIIPLNLNIKQEKEKDERESSTKKEAVVEVKKKEAVVEVKKKGAVEECRKKGAVEEVRKEGTSKRVEKGEEKIETSKKNIKHSDKSKVKKEPKEERKKISKKDKRSRLVPEYPSSPEYSDSESSGHSRRHQYKRYSRSPSPPDKNVKVKEESIDGTDFIHGYYDCEVCHITMNSITTYQTHVNGKRHQKNLKVKNMAIAVAATSLPDPDMELSKYPKVPPGVIRTKVREKAIIQDLVERQIRYCPGLQNVTEIQGIKEIQYYCGMCDAVCSDNSIMPHLSGFKHKLNSLEHFQPDIYAKYKDLRKHVIDRDIPDILRNIQKKEGLGRIVVEKEIMSTDNSSLRCNYAVSSRDPGTSSQSLEKFSFKEYYSQTCQPDTSKSDFYCKICESHMNSVAMWESHIRGKRHLSNVKKAPGAMPSKTRTIRVPNARAILFERLDREVGPEPVVGLDQIQETQIHETNSETYNCFLCGASLTSVDIIDHLLSMKHRIKYLEHIAFPELNVVHSMRDQDLAYSVVRDMCDQVQEREGRGTPSVHVTKNKLLM